MNIRRRITYSNVMATIAAVAAVGGGSFALAASSGGGTIKACAKKKGGALRLASKCKRNERKVSWSKVGPAGTPGRNGINGTNGTNGAPAVVGVTTLPTWGGDMFDTSGDSTWRQQRSLGTFNKKSATTHSIVTVTGSMSSDVFSCLVQVRVDGKASDGTAPTGLTSDNRGVAGQRGPGAALQAPYDGSIVSPFSITADFGTLAAGDHTVTLWTLSNGASNNCQTDPYNYHAGSATIVEAGT